MAAGLQNQYAAAQDATFRSKVATAIVSAAQNISTELSSVTNHANRVILMKAVVNNSELYVPSFALVLAAQGIDNSSTDAAINTMVSSVWNTVAGVA